LPSVASRLLHYNDIGISTTSIVREVVAGQNPWLKLGFADHVVRLAIT